MKQYTIQKIIYKPALKVNAITNSNPIIKKMLYIGFLRINLFLILWSKIISIK